MLKRFYIDNFKSLMDFSLPSKVETTPLPAFSCLVGLNGAGKSTILQAFDFVAQLPSGKLDDWLSNRRWKNSELASKFSKKFTINFDLLLSSGGSEIRWSGSFNTNSLRCTIETVKRNQETILEVSEGRLSYLNENERITMPVKDFLYQGSVLSILNDLNLAPGLAAVKEFASGLKSLELLNPQLIKNRSRDAEDVGIGGEKLTGFIYSLSNNQKATVIQELKKFYPQVTAGTSGALRAGWKTLKITEKYESANKTNLETETMHLNDGMLRILAIIAQFQTDRRFVLLDEIENGINPELVEKLKDYLVNDGRQILVTTHSPMVLNFLEDAIARQGVFLIYKNSLGYTKCGRFFDTPETNKKLGILGPGEVFVDTDLASVAISLEKRTK